MTIIAVTKLGNPPNWEGSPVLERINEAAQRKKRDFTSNLERAASRTYALYKLTIM